MSKYLGDLNETIYNELQKKFNKKFPNSKFDVAFAEYNTIIPFKASENIFETDQKISDESHYILRTLTGIYIKEAFKAMKIDLNDANVFENESEGNIGTPQRIAKVWCGANTSDDTELGSGRFQKPVRIATFPNTERQFIPITKRVAIYSTCSHHALPFSTSFDKNAYAIVSYIPNEFVLGISKLQRLTDFVSRRFWLQEDLTKELHKKITEASQSDDVFVKLVGLKHTCESVRGSKNYDGGFTSEMYSGRFQDSSLRDEILKSVK